MVRRAPGASDTRVYDISGRKPTPIGANLSIGSKSVAAQKRARRKLELQNTETDLIQDFAFPTVSHRVKLSPDGRYVFASGTYPPQIHIYDTDELSLKFKRHVANDIVDFQILEEDWRKFALLTADRYIDLHSQFGSHFRMRVPRHGRDLMLHRGTCDLYVCGEGADVWRVNLEQGRFMAPLPTLSGVNGGNNVCGINPVNSLLAFGGEAATVDIWDPRVAAHKKKPAATLDVAKVLAECTGSRLNPGIEICSLRFDESDGVTLATGTSLGHSLLFDLRSPKPIRVKDQGNGLPIRSIRMHDDGKHCISADPKSIKIWERTSGTNMVTVEPDSDVNHLCVIGSSGVICAAVETQRVKTYYVPALGSAPRWCAFLDNFTEELEIEKQTDGIGGGRGAEQVNEEVYENYKFVSHDELEGLGLAHLTGTDLLKAYMHGYFVHQKLYRRAVDVSAPFAYEKYRKERAKEKLESERQSRITKVKLRNATKKVTVNQRIVETLQQKHKGGKKRSAGSALVSNDDRFSAMFTNKDYTIDEEAERFQFLYPSGTGQKRKQDDDDDSDEDYLEQFELVDEEEENENQERRYNEGRGFLVSSDDEGDADDAEAEESNEEESIGQIQGEESTLLTATGIRRPKRPPKVSRMYEIGQLGEVVGAREQVKLSRPKGDIRRKIREEISLHARITSTNSGEKRTRASNPPRGRRRRDQRSQQ